ncbi:hypothetical protein BG74_08390 [Sodalis-like endosymbiont of Proechinophthirus fluctus]|nr:DUF1480 family protein [Sodalis-like endosymbiont of Proechinophthirus fluctus]KYP95661.1 hypothetical protein BG74_08390 [Sodalis-like endosymbiont of Proechinophthirus fluctus]
MLAQPVLYTPEYVQTFARNGTRFSVVMLEISTAGVNHLEALLQPYQAKGQRGKGRIWLFVLLTLYTAIALYRGVHLVSPHSIRGPFMTKMTVQISSFAVDDATISSSDNQRVQNIVSIPRKFEPDLCCSSMVGMNRPVSRHF